MKLTKKKREVIQEIANNLLFKSFSWGQTKQGHDYWYDVHQNLLEILRDSPLKCEKCGRELP